jgi:hypothetical protein
VLRNPLTKVSESPLAGATEANIGSFSMKLGGPNVSKFDFAFQIKDATAFQFDAFPGQSTNDLPAAT